MVEEIQDGSATPLAAISLLVFLLFSIAVDGTATSEFAGPARILGSPLGLRELGLQYLQCDFKALPESYWRPSLQAVAMRISL